MKKESVGTQLPEVVYSHLETQRRIGEQFIATHGLCYIVSGYLKVADAGEIRTFNAGELVFYRKNFLAKFIKQPDEHCAFKSITVLFDQDSLQAFSQQYGIADEAPFLAKNAVLKIADNVLLKNYFETLLPYFEAPLPTDLINLKRQEALMLLLQINPVLKNVLFNFGQPHKIDLEAFMQQNFRFNVTLKKFAYLTGRSLATFKRDFEKIFHTSPNRWLQQRRLEEAHYLIKEKNRRPSDVYYEVGFESLSHFSYSFKQLYGVNPSALH
ncbi:helix-turn-helix domain-containing protein [Larkinella sp. VNQ87]|uniref:helix-turn-helix domain-containing protein n=1 Tax=Larkinella sp. VNQ87 TaxID=3400921 RepID=UPI003C0C6CCC